MGFYYFVMPEREVRKIYFCYRKSVTLKKPSWHVEEISPDSVLRSDTLLFSCGMITNLFLTWMIKNTGYDIQCLLPFMLEKGLFVIPQLNTFSRWRYSHNSATSKQGKITFVIFRKTYKQKIISSSLGWKSILKIDQISATRAVAPYAVFAGDLNKQQ